MLIRLVEAILTWFCRKYELMYLKFLVFEAYLDFQGWKVQRAAWVRGLWQKGLQGAHDAAAGLPAAQTTTA